MATNEFQAISIRFHLGRAGSVDLVASAIVERMALKQDPIGLLTIVRGSESDPDAADFLGSSVPKSGDEAQHDIGPAMPVVEVTEEGKPRRTVARQPSDGIHFAATKKERRLSDQNVINPHFDPGNLRLPIAGIHPSFHLDRKRVHDSARSRKIDAHLHFEHPTRRGAPHQLKTSALCSRDAACAQPSQSRELQSIEWFLPPAPSSNPNKK
jgi:hypothetical protein